MNNTLSVYGIKNCDTVRKALKWLNTNQLEVTFHDLKKESLTIDLVDAWLTQVGEKTLVNKRGLTWRKLSDSEKSISEKAELIQLIIDNPTIVKRPVVCHQDVWSAGFNEDDWKLRFL